MAKNARTGLYEPRPARQIAKRLAAVMPSPGGLQAVAAALNKGDFARAQIATLHLKLPPFQPEMRRFAKGGYDPNEPRDDHGRWTSGGGDESPNALSARENARLIPATATGDNFYQKQKKQFIAAHLAATLQTANELGVPVENILGLAALESTWGTSRFAKVGKNYFGIGRSAPYAIGSMKAKDGPRVLSTYSSYEDSLKSFVALSGDKIRNVRDPIDFATKLQKENK